jgi:hypothetical protein
MDSNTFLNTTFRRRSKATKRKAADSPRGKKQNFSGDCEGAGKNRKRRSNSRVVEVADAVTTKQR